MYALALQRIQICRQCCHQCFTFTCSHLGNTSLMHHDAAHQLYGKMLHIQHIGTGSRLSYHCIRLRQNIIQCFALCQTILKFLCLSSQLFIRKVFILGAQCFNLRHDGLDFLDFLFTVVPKYFFQETHLVHLIFLFSHVPKADSHSIGTLLHYYSIAEEHPRTQGKLAHFRGCSKSFKKSLYKFHIFSQYHYSSDEKQRILFRFCFISLISTQAPPSSSIYSTSDDSFRCPPEGTAPLR